MLNWLKDKIRSTWYKLSAVPPGYFTPGYSEYVLHPNQRQIVSPYNALTLSPFWAGVRLYQTTMASLPLIAYEKDASGGRHRLEDKAIFNLLHERPNPGMSRAAFFEYAVKELFLEGNFFANISWSNNHRPLAIYPIPARSVTDIQLDGEWRKTYTVQTGQSKEVYQDDEMIHIYNFSHDGIWGVSFVDFAYSSLGLHSQVLESASSYYRNAATPSGYLKFPGKLGKDTKDTIKTEFKDNYQGACNTGKVPVLMEGGEFQKFPGSTAEDAQILEALNSSVTDIARWFGLSPLMLGDLTRGTYSNLSADNLAFYQRSLMPLLNKFELELNYKLFGAGADRYCEFLTEALLRADAITQAKFWQIGVQAGYLLRSEIRSWLNLSPVEGLDKPIYMANLVAIDAQTEEAEQPPAALQEDGQEDDEQEEDVEDAA